ACCLAATPACQLGRGQSPVRRKFLSDVGLLSRRLGGRISARHLRRLSIADGKAHGRRSARPGLHRTVERGTPPTRTNAGVNRQGHRVTTKGERVTCACFAVTPIPICPGAVS